MFLKLNKPASDLHKTPVLNNGSNIDKRRDGDNWFVKRKGV